MCKEDGGRDLIKIIKNVIYNIEMEQILKIGEYG